MRRICNETYYIKKMKIALLGDLGFFGKYSLENNEELFKYFEKVAFFLKRFDYVIGNLETPFAENLLPKGAKSAYISTNLKSVELLKYLNINIVNLANNHIFDYGIEGYEKTKEILKKNNIKYFGTEGKEIFLEKKGGKVALNGWCCYSTNALGYSTEKNNIGVDVLNTQKIKNKIKVNNKNHYLNIASIHCGEEHINYPNYDHIEMGRNLANEGLNYIFYGHHPHVIQGIEMVKKSLLAYSLGNFCFDDVYNKKSKSPLIKQKIENKKSIILSLEIEGDKLKKYEIIPIFCSENEMILKGESLFDDIQKYSNYLNLNKKDYKKIRDKELTNYYMSRKKQRNIYWYIKRLNYNSVRMIYELKKNRRLYLENIKS